MVRPRSNTEDNDTQHSSSSMSDDEEGKDFTMSEACESKSVILGQFLRHQADSICVVKLFLVVRIYIQLSS